MSEKDGFGAKWYEQRQAWQRQRHAQRARATPEAVAAAINFYAPSGTPVVDGNTLLPIVNANLPRETVRDDFIRLCLADGLPEPVREYPFHGTRKWRFDYAWPRFRVAVEREGGLWSKEAGAKAAHAMPLAILRDMAKGNAAAILGWRVLRYTPEQLLQGAVAELKGLLR